MMTWIDKSLSAVERAAANTRAAIKERQDLKEQLFIAKAALLRIRENAGEYPNKDIAAEALKEMEKI